MVSRCIEACAFTCKVQAFPMLCPLDEASAKGNTRIEECERLTHETKMRIWRFSKIGVPQNKIDGLYMFILENPIKWMIYPILGNPHIRLNSFKCQCWFPQRLQLASTPCSRSGPNSSWSSGQVAAQPGCNRPSYVSDSAKSGNRMPQVLYQCFMMLHGNVESTYQANWKALKGSRWSGTRSSNFNPPIGGASNVASALFLSDLYLRSLSLAPLHDGWLHDIVRINSVAV